MTARIIVPLDSSDLAEQALPLARKLAQRKNALLVLLSVVEVSVDFMAWVDSAAVMLEDEVNDWIKERQEYLDSISANIVEVPVETAIRVGTPSKEIAVYLNEQECAIAFTTSHGRTGVEQIVLGSVTFRVIHESDCPTFVVRAPVEADDSRPPAFTRVLIPLDGSQFAASVIDRIVEIIGEPKPAVHFVQVMNSINWPSHSMDRGLVGEYIRASRDEAGEQLTEITEHLKTLGYDASWEIRHGNDVEQILSTAAEIGASEIAMATHGRGGLGRAFIGSTAQHILHRADIPLLLIRPESDA